MTCPKCKTFYRIPSPFCDKCGHQLFIAALKRPNRQQGDFFLQPQDYTVGRESDNKIVLTATTISRYHARFAYEADHFVLQDLQSKNGTFVNHQLIDRTTLKHQDLIQIGDEVFVFENSFSTAVLTNTSATPEIEKILKILATINQTFHAPHSIDEVLNVLIDAILELTQFQRGFLIIYDRDRNPEYKIIKQNQSIRATSDIVKISSTAINKVRETGQILVAENIPQNAELNAQSSILNLELQSIICIPLLALNTMPMNLTHEGFSLNNHQILGAIYLDTQAYTPPVSVQQREILHTISAQVSLAIENTLLVQRPFVDRRLDAELQLAGDIQRHLVPEIKKKSAVLDIYGTSQACRQVGGDYLELFQLNGKSGVVIADVCGKGIPAALLMSSLQAAIKTQAAYVQSIQEIIGNLNQMMYQNTPANRFVTFFVGQFDQDFQQFDYVNCGHNPGLVFKGEHSPLFLKGTSLPLGITEKLEFESRSIRFESGDLLVLYTDGVTEIQNPAQENFGIERLKNFIYDHRLAHLQNFSAESLVEAILKQLHQFSGEHVQQDDTTLIAIYRN